MHNIGSKANPHELCCKICLTLTATNRGYNMCGTDIFLFLKHFGIPNPL